MQLSFGALDKLPTGALHLPVDMPRTACAVWERGAWHDDERGAFAEFAEEARAAVVEEMARRPALFRSPPTVARLTALCPPDSWAALAQLPAPDAEAHAFGRCRGTVHLAAVRVSAGSLQPVWQVQDFVLCAGDAAEATAAEAAPDAALIEFDEEAGDAEAPLLLALEEAECRDILLSGSEGGGPVAADAGATGASPASAESGGSGSGSGHSASGARTEGETAEERRRRLRKAVAKQRVKEAYVRAQLAAREARREEARFYRHYDLSDGESTFSEFDDETVMSSDGESMA